jgi:hypothetical protein
MKGNKCKFIDYIIESNCDGARQSTVASWIIFRPRNTQMTGKPTFLHCKAIKSGMTLFTKVSQFIGLVYLDLTNHANIIKAAKFLSIEKPKDLPGVCNFTSRKHAAKHVQPSSDSRFKTHVCVVIAK